LSAADKCAGLPLARKQGQRQPPVAGPRPIRVQASRPALIPATALRRTFGRTTPELLWFVCLRQWSARKFAAREAGGRAVPSKPACRVLCC